MPNLLQRLLDEKFVKENPVCNDSTRLFGESLVYSFGINNDNPTAPADEKTGYKGAINFLSKVCGAFSNPSDIISVAPFSNAYLGSAIFEKALDVIIKRAKAHPDEHKILDEVLTGVALVSPDKRQDFLDSVKNAQIIDDDVFGLADLIIGADNNADFTTADEFPAQFRTPDVSRATALIGKFVEHGFFVPGKGFTKKYYELIEKMKSFDYMAADPSPEHGIIIAPPRIAPELVKGLDLKFEVTFKYDARPNNNGINPSIALINTGVSPVEVQKLYPETTLLYVVKNKAHRKTIEAALHGKSELLVDATDGDLNKLLRAHLSFINKGRRKDLVDFSDILRSSVTEAVELARAGNEYFFEVRDLFDDMGRRALIDSVIETEKIKLPHRTNNKLVMLISNSESELLPYFHEINVSKKVKHYKNVPGVEETGMPFVVITNKPITEAQVRERLPSATVLYFARNNQEENAILNANGPETFVVNAEVMKKAYIAQRRDEGERTDPDYLGRIVVDMFFNTIAKSRAKGIVGINGAVLEIAEEIKKVRDEIVFATGLNDYYRSARNYWNLQEQFKGVPLIAQKLDGVLMQTCPTGGCLKMRNKPYGGCGANYGRVLIEFAADYRKQIGEDNFIAELTKFHNGRIKEPWYIKEYIYARQFPGGLGRTTKFKMTF